MNRTSLPPGASRKSLHHNVKVQGLASLLNDIASEMIFPLLPNFLALDIRRPLVRQVVLAQRNLDLHSRIGIVAEDLDHATIEFNGTSC